MDAREWQIGVVGTFDVENYGDLLFPLIAEAELAERLGRVRLHRISYRPKGAADWPYPVTSVAELPRLMPSLDGLLIGGGFLIRFDKDVAPGYGPPTEVLHHPTALWLTPALIALEHGTPLIWNAPGMHRNELPAWAEPLLRLACTHSAYIAVRDEPSRQALSPFAGGEPVVHVPDTGFGLDRLLAARPSASAELARLREPWGLDRPYIVVQSALGMVPFLRFLRQDWDRLRDYTILALPISPVLGEEATIVENELPSCIRLPAWPHPLLLAEIIRNAEAVAGHSYHLAITALTAGVPVFSPAGLTGKYTAFAGIESIHALPSSEEADFDFFLSRLGRTAPPPQIAASAARLAIHWDRVADLIRAGKSGSREAVSRFWQALPTSLEERAVEAERRLGEARAEVAAAQSRIHDLVESTSWRITAPLRFLGRRVSRFLSN